MEPDPRFWCIKRVCVTGGTGFLGYHLVCQLLELGAEVRVLARDRSWTSLSVDRRGELALVRARFDAAIACLHEIEREISSYRGGGYR